MTTSSNPSAGPRTLHGSRWTPYRAVLASRVRSQASHRASFGLDLVSSLLVGVVEPAEVAVLFTSVSVIGGFDLAAILLVFGLADLCFSVADMVFGHCDNLPEYVRTGRLDVFYLRRGRSLFDAEALAEYRRCYTDPTTIHAMCEDYRAGATIDMRLDEEDQKAGRRIARDQDGII